jgi:CRISPR system Cascade subunit CasB
MTAPPATPRSEQTPRERTPSEPVSSEPTPVKDHRTRRLGPLGNALDWRIIRLQADYLRDKPTARADLARLRRGLGKPAGSVPEIWDITIGAVPESLQWNRDEPGRAEHAAHAVLCLFALHQQSLSVAAHVPGTSFGQAVARLSRAEGRSADAVTRRFMAVATAGSINEVLAHVRGLVTQLRGIKQGLDYARLADDLLAVLTPGRATTIRLAWGRDFYRTIPDTDPDTTVADPADSFASASPGATDE